MFSVYHFAYSLGDCTSNMSQYFTTTNIDETIKTRRIQHQKVAVFRVYIVTIFNCDFSFFFFSFGSKSMQFIQYTEKKLNSSAC